MNFSRALVNGLLLRHAGQDFGAGEGYQSLFINATRKHEGRRSDTRIDAPIISGGSYIASARAKKAHAYSAQLTMHLLQTAHRARQATD